MGIYKPIFVTHKRFHQDGIVEFSKNYFQANIVKFRCKDCNVHLFSVLLKKTIYIHYKKENFLFFLGVWFCVQIQAPTSRSASEDSSAGDR